MKVLSRIALVLLVATGCYLPSDFEADFNIDPKGGFAFRYKGDITSIPLLSKIGKGKLSGDELTKNIAIYKRDLARDRSFKSVEYIENARYKVHYEYQSNIHDSKSFTFIRSNAIFVRLKKRKDGFTELVGNRPPKRYVDELIEKGFDTKGVLRIWTDAKVLKHNAATVKKGPKTLYTWPINSMRDPLPSMILLLK
ncbi:MAG: hypothetical protein HOM25_05255 [Rhodospirillaceae bacterium]|nr:hypothetical protein [Rhodospirillaceae bacterium]MBT5666305.1 hypothetical protein [Rhodospirillaceae bacterium]MBT5809024.1 hypothetical protein [Rhodospirillaceae bacterium]